MEQFASNPSADGAILAPVQWVGGILTGPAATAIAILAVAALGLAMVRGHIPAGRGVQVVLGCFILFSADTIARGLLTASASLPTAAEAPPIPPSRPRFEAPVPTPPAYDPYAGAAIPSRPMAPGTGDIFRR